MIEIEVYKAHLYKSARGRVSAPGRAGVGKPHGLL